MVRANTAATLKAKEEGKTVAYTFIVCWMDEIMRAMDIVPAWGESYSGICAAKRESGKFLEKAEAENFPARSARTRHATSALTSGGRSWACDAA